VTDLVVRHGPITAVDGLSFTAATGRITAVLGPNGAGKTTTVETLEGYRRPSAGTVRVLGLDPVADRRELVPRIGVMLQQGGVAPGIRPEEVVNLFASYYDDPVDPDELLALVGLEERRRSSWRRLSGGEQQRLSLALALVGRPEVVFLDEPTSGIDPLGRQVVRDVMQRLRDEGVAVLVTTHDLDEAERVADEIVIIDRGRLLATGSPAALMTSERGGELRFRAPSGIDVDSLAGVLGAPVSEGPGGEYVVGAEASPTTVAALTAWLAEHDLPLGDLRAGRQSLEDVFLRLTADADPASARGGTTAPTGRRRRDRR
jgi:ABC-2 type transport system ATP-binding protein